MVVLVAVIVMVMVVIVVLDRKKQCKKIPFLKCRNNSIIICIYITAQKNGSGKTIFCTDTS